MCVKERERETHTHTHTCTHTCAPMHIRTHAHTHTHIHAQTHSAKQKTKQTETVSTRLMTHFGDCVCRFCLVFPQFVQFFLMIPRVAASSILGVPVTGKTFTYILGLQVTCLFFFVDLITPENLSLLLCILICHFTNPSLVMHGFVVCVMCGVCVCVCSMCVACVCVCVKVIVHFCT